MIVKNTLRGPITALVQGSIENDTLLMWGCGGSLHYCSHTDEIGAQQSVQVFDFHTIHGIRIDYNQELYSQLIIVYGDIRVAFIAFLNGNLYVAHSDCLDDMVVDCIVLDTQKKVFAVAYGHNMVDIRMFQDFHGGSVLIHRCWHPDITVLFAANFCRATLFPEHLIIATGTVFGYLSIWKVPVAEPFEKYGTVCGKVQAHEGVVFRCVWSEEGNKLLTVSDDRTVRLFNINFISDEECLIEKLFEGWGHICRVWDAVFVHGGHIATASEDGTVRVWDLADQQCKAILNGHIGSVWKLICSRDGKHLISAGNDSTVRCWSLSLFLTCCPHVPLSTAQQITIPSYPNVVQTNSNRRQNGVNSLFISREGRFIVIICIDGGVWLVDTAKRANAAAYHWNPVVHMHKTIITGDVHFNARNEGVEIRIAVAFNDQSCSYLHVLHSPGNIDSIHIRTRAPFVPHSLKCVNLWILPDLLVNDEVCLCSATTQGICALWSISSSYSNVKEINKLGEFVTLRKEIASSVLSLCFNQGRYLVIGDSRGGVNIFQPLFPSELKSNDQIEIPLLQYFHRIHGRDPVSCLQYYSSGFVSAGHDGYVSFFEFFPLKEHFYFKNAVSMHPMSTPDLIHIIPESNSILLGGYHSNSYMVLDLFSGTQFMSIDGGGWKRPHHCIVTYLDKNKTPEILFACPVPFGAHETQLQVFGSLGLNAQQQGLNSLWVQKNSTFFGRVSYCTVVIQSPLGEEYMVIGGEDCTAKVYTLPELCLVQETTLSKNSSLRALAHSSNNEYQGLVLGAGGKLLYYVWLYDFSRQSHGLPLRKAFVGSVWPNATQDHRILSVQCVYVGPDKTVELDCFVLLLADSRGILTILQCDVDYLNDSMTPCLIQPLYSIEASESPLLSCSTLLLSKHGTNLALLCAVGDTKGASYVTIIPLRDEETMIKRPYLAASYEDHSMGTNAVCLSLLASDDEELAFDVMLCSVGDDQALVCRRILLFFQVNEVNVFSNLTFSAYHLLRDSSGAKDMLSYSMVNVGKGTKKEAAGAAMKGVVSLPPSTSSSSLEIMTIAYDQRLSQWSIPTPLLSMKGHSCSSNWQVCTDGVGSSDINEVGGRDAKERKIEQITWQESGIEDTSDTLIDVLDIMWKDGVVANIAEISSLYSHLHLIEGRCDMIVVGEGFQIVTWE